MVMLRVIELKTDDVFQDMVRVHQKHRRQIPAGRVCKVRCNGKSITMVARGARRNQTEAFAIDLRSRNRLGISSYGQVVDVEFEQGNWFDELRWGWQASEPISRLAARLGIISLALGLLSLVLGAIPLLGSCE